MQKPTVSPYNFYIVSFLETSVPINPVPINRKYIRNLKYMIFIIRFLLLSVFIQDGAEAAVLKGIVVHYIDIHESHEAIFQ